MKEIKTKSGHVIVVHDSIETMSCERYHKYEKMMILDAGVGSDVDSLASRLNTIMQLIERDPKKAMIEARNMGQALWMMEQSFSPKLRALACRVESIDGEKVEDMSDDGITELTQKLEKILNMKELDEETRRAKKKLEDELTFMFPERKNVAEIELMEARLLTILDAIARDADITESVKSVDDRLWAQREIVDFGEWDVQFDKSFEKVCLRIGENLHLSAKKMTQMEYESAVELMMEDTKERNKKH